MRVQSEEESDRPPTPTHRRRRTAGRDDNDDHFVPNPEPDTTEVCKMLTRAIPEAFENMNEPESMSKIVSALQEGLKHFTRKLKRHEGTGKHVVFSNRDRPEDNSGGGGGGGGGCEPKSTASTAESSTLFVPNAPSSSSRAEMNPFRLHIRRPAVRPVVVDTEMKPKRP
uniref:Uncharacterized protein n=1 Tax=Plectus sambesii TaxID=2011161 RepID=A0A914VMG5_9BILA